jgi:hypothetical protein
MVYGGSGPTGWQEATRGREEEGGFKGGKMKCKFSSIMKINGDRKQSSPLCDYREAEDAGLSFLPIHIKKSQNVKIQGNKVRC